MVFSLHPPRADWRAAMTTSRATDNPTTIGESRMAADLKEANKESSGDLLALRTPEETIRVRAYEIYLERGSHDGLDVEDWLRAEIECLGS